MIAQKSHEQKLMSIIKSFNSTLEECTQDLKNSLKLSFSEMITFLINEAALGVNDSLTLMNQIVSEAKNSAQFTAWLGWGFLQVWIDLQLADGIGLGSQQFVKLLKIKINVKQELDLKAYIGQKQKGSQIKSLQETGLQDLVLLIQENSDYKLLKQKCQKKTVEQNPEQTMRKQLKQIKQRQKQLKQQLKKMKGSILDQLIQENLIECLQIDSESQDKIKFSYTPQQFQNFKKQLLQISTKFGVSNPELKRLLSLKLEQNQDYFSAIINIRSKIHPVFIPLLINLIQKNKDAKKQIQDKDIVVLLGPSGAGKSTSVQVILGYKLELLKIKGEINTLSPVGGLKKQHEQFVAKASSQSTTKYVSAIKLTNLPYEYQDQGDVYIADTPGFFDSGGIIVDTNNGLSTIRALGAASSIRFIFLINQKNWGTKGQGFKKLATMISRIFKQYEKKSVIFFLNCFNEQSLQQLPAKMKDLYQKLEPHEKGDRKYVAVINHFKYLVQQVASCAQKKKISFTEALKKNSPQLVALDPINPDLDEILQKILNKQRQLTSPSEYLGNIINEQIRSALCSQTSNLQTIIKNCLKLKNMDACRYYIKNLSDLARETVDVDDLGQADKKVKIIFQEIQERCREIFKQYSIIMQKRIPSLRIDSSTVQEAKQIKKNLESLQDDYSKLDGFKIQNYRQMTDQLINQTSKSLIKKLQQQRTKQAIEAILLFSEHFKKELKEQLIQKFIEEIKQIQYKIKECINKQQYQNLQELLNQKEKMHQITRCISDMKKYENNQWETALLKKIDDRNQKFKQTIEQIERQTNYKIVDKDINIMKSTLSVFQTVDSSRRQILKKIPESFRQTRKKCLELARKFIKQIQKLVSQDSDQITKSKNISVVENSKLNASKMSEIKQIQAQVNGELSRELSRLAGLINSKREFINRQIQLMESNNWIQMKNVYTSIEVLDKLIGLVEEEDRQKCSEILNKSRDKLQCKVQKLLQQLKLIPCTIQNADITALQILNIYKIIDGILTDQDNSSESSQSQQKSKVKNVCNRIKSETIKKFKQIVDSIYAFMKDQMNYQQKQIDGLGGGLTTFIRIKKFFQSVLFTNFRPAEINKQIQDCKKQFYKNLKTCYNKLCQKTRKILQDIYDRIQVKSIVTILKNKQGGVVLQRDQVYKLVRLISILQKIKNCKEISTALFTQMGASDINEELKDLKVDIKQRINSTFDQCFKGSKNIPICYTIIAICQNLRPLDNKKQQNQQGFKFSSIAQQLQKKLTKAETFFQRQFDTFIVPQYMTSIPTVNKYMKYYVQFGLQTTHQIKFQEMLERIITVKEQDQQALQKKIFLTLNKKDDNQTNIQNIEMAIRQLSNFIIKLKQVIGQNLSSPSQIVKKYKQKMQKCSAISERTITNISNAGIKLIQLTQNQINKLINSKKYQEASEKVSKISKITQICNILNIQKFNQSMEQKKKELQTDLSISDFYQQKIKKGMEQRDKKFQEISLSKIRQSKDLKKQIQSYSQEQQQGLKIKIMQKFDQKVQQIRSNCINLSFDVIMKQCQNIKSCSGNLPITWRGQIQGKIKEQFDEIKRARKQQQEQMQTNFSFQKSIEFFKGQKKQYLRNLGLKKVEQILNQQLNKINVHQIDAKSLIQKGLHLFVTNVDNKTLETKQLEQYKKILQKSGESYGKLLQSYTDKNCVNKLKQTFQNKSIIKKLNQQKIKQQIQSSVKNMVNICQFVSKNNKLLNQNQLDNNINKMKQIFNHHGQQCVSFLNKISFEQLKKHKDEFFYHYILNDSIKPCIQYLDVQLKPIKQIYTQVKAKQTQIELEIERISKQIQGIRNHTRKVELFSEIMMNQSNEKRKTKIQELEKNIASLNQIAQIYRKIFKEDIKKAHQQQASSMRNQLIQKMQQCKDIINKGFQDQSRQFPKVVDLTFNMFQILKSATFIKIQPKLLSELQKLIEKNYNDKIFLLKQQSKNLLEQKQKVNSRLSQLKNNYRRQQNQKFKELQNTFTNKQQHAKTKRDTDLKNESDATKHDAIKTRCQNQINQFSKQLFQQKKEFKQMQSLKQKKQETKIYSEIEKRIAIYSKIATILYKATKQISYQRSNFESVLKSVIDQDYKNLGRKIFNFIYTHMSKCSNNYSSMLINQYDIFKKNNAIKWEAKVKGNGIEYVLKNLNVGQHIKSKLRLKYNSYSQQFKSCTNQYQKFPKPETIDDLISKIKNESQALINYYHNNGSQTFAKPEILLAKVFALWTITHSQVGEDQVVEFYYQPHPAQIVAIFLCLGFVKEDNEQPREFYGKMAQVGTGQGKSVVLAGISSYLALCGFQVNCVCYSMYLSERDRNAFTSLFERLQIDKLISYGTFDMVCESLFSKNKGKDSQGFRQDVKNLLTAQQPGFFKKLFNSLTSFLKNSLSSLVIKKKKQNKSIMLIDQVDVFFQPSFFGSLFCPDVSIQSQQIRKLMKAVWQQYRKNSQIQNNFIGSIPEYKEVQKKYGKMKQILQQQIKGMILGCRGCDHDYVVQDDLIQYRDHDGISSKINYGFQTTFAYLKEHDCNRISYGSLEKALKISLIVAQFSYAMLPKYFRTIIGVTGTYEDMPDYKKNYMSSQYQVTRAYIIPSVYGDSKRRLINAPKIVPGEKHTQQIIKNIKQVHNTGRPVLVFFKNASQLECMFNSPGYKDLQAKTSFLDQTHKADERDLRIKKTCNKGNITLMTSAFGRGTDFLVFDQSIFAIDHGGLHVIQTFISIDRSQQVQIQGRTARQGNPGTFSLIIPVQDLEQLQIKNSNPDDFQKQVKQSRKKKDQKDSQQIIKMLNSANEKHEQCLKLYLDQKTDQSKIIKYVAGLNRYQQIRKAVCKTSIFVDATGSMSTALKSLLSILDQVVKDSIQIIQSNKTASSFQLQLGVYRNYNCPYETLFQVTPFETTSLNLQAFLKKVQPLGGMGNQALQIAYNHINETKGIDQVIIIGDAAANTDQQTRNKRLNKGESYWQGKKLPLLSAEHQLQRITASGIPIHSFFIYAQGYFRQVSRRTGGYCEYFDLNAKNASQKLSQFIVERILEKSASDANQAEAMKQAYRKRISA